MSQTKPLVSVIIPVYNIEKYLEKCINSVLEQTYKNLEIILVDDGSKDSSGRICDAYENSYQNIKVLHKTNGGLSDARNQGLDISKGEYISFIDSDDYISPVFVETMMAAISKGNCGIAALKGGTDFWDESVYPRLAETTEECSIEYVAANESLERMFYQQIATGAPFKICRRELYEVVRFPNGYYYEDVATTYKLFLQAEKAAIIYGNLYAYRKRADSIIRQKFNEKKLTALDIFDQLINDEALKEVGLRRAACSRVYAMLFSVFLQVPAKDKEMQKHIWRKLRTVRKDVILDKSKLMRRKNKYAALIALLGMRLSYRIGRFFGQKDSMGKKTQKRRNMT